MPYPILFVGLRQSGRRLLAVEHCKNFLETHSEGQVVILARTRWESRALGDRLFVVAKRYYPGAVQDQHLNDRGIIYANHDWRIFYGQRPYLGCPPGEVMNLVPDLGVDEIDERLIDYLRTHPSVITCHPDAAQKLLNSRIFNE